MVRSYHDGTATSRDEGREQGRERQKAANVLRQRRRSVAASAARRQPGLPLHCSHSLHSRPVNTRIVTFGILTLLSSARAGPAAPSRLAPAAAGCLASSRRISSSKARRCKRPAGQRPTLERHRPHCRRCRRRHRPVSLHLQRQPHWRQSSKQQHQSSPAAVLAKPARCRRRRRQQMRQPDPARRRRQSAAALSPAVAQPPARGLCPPWS